MEALLPPRRAVDDLLQPLESGDDWLEMVGQVHVPPSRLLLSLPNLGEALRWVEVDHVGSQALQFPPRLCLPPDQLLVTRTGEVVGSTWIQVLHC